MQFGAAAEHYDRFMGRCTPVLASGLADAAGVRAGQRVVDVGCGPGGLLGLLPVAVGLAAVVLVWRPGGTRR